MGLRSIALFTRLDLELFVFRIRGGPRCLVVCPKDNEIASINPFRESWNEDAELIADAPRMLELIRELHDFAETDATMGVCRTWAAGVS